MVPRLDNPVSLKKLAHLILVTAKFSHLDFTFVLFRISGRPIEIVLLNISN